MELHELHILQGKPGAQHHGVSVAGANMRGCTREISPAVAAGRQDHKLRTEAMNGAVVELHADDAAAAAILHDQVDREELNEEFGLVSQRLTVERMQHCMAGPVGRRASALRRRTLAELGGHAAERALVDAAVLGARERHAPMLEFIHGGRRIAAEILDRILIAEPIRPLNGVVHVPSPIVWPHVAERRRDAALRRDRVRAGRKYLGDAGRPQSRLRTANGRPQSRATGTDNDDVERMVGNRIGGAATSRSGVAVEGGVGCHAIVFRNFPSLAR